jgi:hypothetical protein
MPNLQPTDVEDEVRRVLTAVRPVNGNLPFLTAYQILEASRSYAHTAHPGTRPRR